MISWKRRLLLFDPYRLLAYPLEAVHAVQRDARATWREAESAPLPAEMAYQHVTFPLIGGLRSGAGGMTFIYSLLLLRFLFFSSPFPSLACSNCLSCLLYVP